MNIIQRKIFKLDSIILFLFGFFLLFPFLKFNLGFGNIRFEDVLVFLLLFMLPKKIYINTLIFSSVMIFFLLFSVMLRESFKYEFDNYALFRSLTTLFIFVVVVAAINTKEKLKLICQGLLSGGVITSIYLIVIFLVAINSSGTHSGDLYFLKENIADLTSYNANTYGLMFLLASFSSYILYYQTSSTRYRVLSIYFCTIPFLYIIKRDILGISIGLFFVFLLSLERKKRLLLVLLIIYPLIFSVIILHDSLYDLFVEFSSGRDSLYSSALQAILANPFGYGSGTEQEVIGAYGAYKEAVSHNSFLSMSIDLGVMPVIFLLCYIVYYFVIIFKGERSVRNFLLFYWVALFVQSNFGNSYYFYKHSYIIFALIIICVIVYSNQRRI